MRVGHVWIGSVVFGVHLDPRSSLLRLLVNGFSPGHTALHYFGACHVVKHDNQASHSGHRFPFIISNDCKATEGACKILQFRSDFRSIQVLSLCTLGLYYSSLWNPLD
ncbi:hypothetical protein COP1_032019 [Malus domestica]